MKQFLKKAWEIYSPFRGKVMVIFLFIAVSQALALVAPYFQGMLIDCLIQKKPMSYTYWIIGASLAAYVLQNVVIGYYREVFELKNLDFTIPEYASKKTMQKILNLSVGQHIAQNSAVKESIVSKGQVALTTLAHALMYDVLPIIIQVVFMVGALLYMSWPLGLIVVIGVILFIGAIVIGNFRIMKPLRKAEKMYHENSCFRGEIYRNIEHVLINSQGKRAIRESDDNLQRLHSRFQHIWLINAKWAYSRNLITGLTRFAVMVLGIYYVYQGFYTPGYLVIFWTWSNNALSQLGMVGALQRRIVNSIVSIRKYFELLDLESSVKILPNPVRPKKFFGRIEFKNVTFEYPRRDKQPDVDDESNETSDSAKPEKETGPALKNVSFIIEPGQTVAFVGESGAGKTTSIHALLRAEDVKEGQITIDGNDLRVLDLNYFRESVGLVEQHVPLFDESLRYNIMYALSEQANAITEKKLNEIAEMSCIDRFYDRLEKGFETFIGERGIKLSGGERQRVGIARALLKNPDILIFDEATSNLDAQNESLIRGSIEKISKGRTTIIIAHRFSTIRNADKIIVFERGEIAGQGTHEELMFACPEYQRLVHNQMGNSSSDTVIAFGQ